MDWCLIDSSPFPLDRLVSSLNWWLHQQLLHQRSIKVSSTFPSPSLLTSLFRCEHRSFMGDSQSHWMCSFPLRLSFWINGEGASLSPFLFSIPPSQTELALRCLRSIPYNKIIDAQRSLYNSTEDFYGPSIDGDVRERNKGIPYNKWSDPSFFQLESHSNSSSLSHSHWNSQCWIPYWKVYILFFYLKYPCHLTVQIHAYSRCKVSQFHSNRWVL